MPARSGPGPLAVVHPILIATAVAGALIFAAWEAREFSRTGALGAAIAGGAALLVAAGFAVYLRSLRGLAARLSRRDALVLLLALLLPATAHGGSITLETTLTTEVADTAVKVTVAVRNTGTDTANNVKPRLRLGDEARDGDLVRELAPQKRREWTFEFPRPLRPGRFPVLSSVAYDDAGFRSFSAVSAAVADIGDVVPPRLHGAVGSVELSGSARTTVSVTNDADVARDVRLALALPQELGGWRDLGVVRQEPGQTRELRVDIENAGALAGSRYAFWAIARSLVQDRETVQLLPATATVIQPRTIDWQSHLTDAALWLAAVFCVVEAILQSLALRRTVAGREERPA